MYETVTVDQAIAKAQRTINLPAILLMAGGCVVSAYLATHDIIPLWVAFTGGALAVGIAWLYWSIRITKWRVWAFENVRNVHELKKRAVREKLIYAEGSFWNRTEIWSATDREKWQSLQAKFNREDVFIDDLTVPGETIIYYSKGKTYTEMGVILLIMAVGIFLIVATKRYIIGAIGVLFCGYWAYRQYRKVTDTKPQIILSDKGIQTASTPFYEWSVIFNEDAIARSVGKTTIYYLVYDCPAGHVKLEIDELATDQKKLYNLLNIYRGRYQKRNRTR